MFLSFNSHIYVFNFHVNFYCAGKFPGESGVVAPGMSCQYPIKFAPDSLADYEDVIKVSEMCIPAICDFEFLILTCRSHQPMCPLSHLALSPQQCTRVKSRIIHSSSRLFIYIFVLQIKTQVDPPMAIKLQAKRPPPVLTCKPCDCWLKWVLNFT